MPVLSVSATDAEIIPGSFRKLDSIEWTQLEQVIPSIYGKKWHKSTAHFLFRIITMYIFVTGMHKETYLTFWLIEFIQPWTEDRVTARLV